MRKVSGILGFILLLCISLSATGTTKYVDGSASAPGDGTSRQKALEAIQARIGAALSRDTVIVAQESYVRSGKNIALTCTDPLNHAGRRSGHAPTFPPATGSKSQPFCPVPFPIPG